MKNHVMRTEVVKGQGKLVFTCPTCERRVEFFSAEGRLKVLQRGDPDAVHVGGSITEMSAEVDQTVPSRNTLH